jgi:methylenetetrahydrofolate reductase (NADPH)
MVTASPAHPAATDADAKQQIIGFIAGFTAETTPGAAAKIADYREHLRPGTTVFITFLPGSDFADTVAVAKRLKDEGFVPVPHFAARSIRDHATFETNLKRCVEEAGVEHALAIGGAVDEPVGDFTSSMELLETGLFDRYGIKTIGVAGHPEGSPDIPEREVERALAWKNDFARRTGAELYIITQFCFEAAPIIAWDKALQAAGNKLPIRIGVPGPATIKTLLAHAQACGIGNSMRFLKRQALNVTKLMTVSAPDRLVAELAAYQANDPGCGITGVHMYPLGGLRRTAAWTYAVVDGRFTLKRDGRSFAVDADLD